MFESCQGHLTADYVWVREPTSFSETLKLLTRRRGTTTRSDPSPRSTV